MVSLSICFNIFPLGQKDVFAATLEEKEYTSFKDIIESTLYQYQLNHDGNPKNADELISYANHLQRGGFAITIWDDLVDNDQIIGNTFSEDRFLADGNYILFQTKDDAERQTDNLIRFDINAIELVNETDRTRNFSLLDQMDKSKNDNILQDGFGNTVSYDAFINTTSKNILLRADSFEIIESTPKFTPQPETTIQPQPTHQPKPSTKVTGIKLDAKDITLEIGGEDILTATIQPFNALEQGVRWTSSNESIATVDLNDEASVTVIAEGEGTCTITAASKDGNKTATCNVTVESNTIAVKKVILDDKLVSLKLGEDYQLTATITPNDATEQSVLWSSDNKGIASVDEDGNITAKKAGNAKITATTVDGKKTAICQVTVIGNIKVTSVVLDSKTLRMGTGSDETLTATVKPFDATNQNVTWSSSNKGIADVDEEGNVTTKKTGKVKITATTEDGRKTATCDITVIAPIKVTGIVLDEKSLTMSIGQDQELTATVKPFDATNKDVIWSSNNKGIANVDEEGTVTAKKAGKAKITATTEDGRKTATCEVIVIDPIKVTGIVLDENLLIMSVGEEQELTATVKPFNATNKNITWSSSNKGIADVDEEGTVTAKKAGKVKIIATTEDGEKITECTVTVK